MLLITPHPLTTTKQLDLSALHSEERSRVASYRFFRATQQIDSMVRPVLLMLALVLGFVLLLVRPQAEADHLQFRVLLLYQQPAQVCVALCCVVLCCVVLCCVVLYSLRLIELDVHQSLFCV